MGLRICEDCKKREMVRKDKPNPLCGNCRKKRTLAKLIDGRKERKECMRCGGERDSEFLACKECRERSNKRHRERYKINPYKRKKNE